MRPYGEAGDPMPRAWRAICIGSMAILSAGCLTEDFRSPRVATPTPPPIVRPALASPVASPSPSPAAEVQSYTIRPGDTLSSIAQQLYGDATEWRLLFEANRDRLASPESLQVGVAIRVPPRPPRVTATAIR